MFCSDRLGLALKFVVDDPDRFLDVNSFFCINHSMRVLPESCLEMLIRAHLKKKNVLLEGGVCFYEPCIDCKNDLIVNFSSVIKRRAEERGTDLDLEEVRCGILPEYIEHVKKVLIARYQDRFLIESIFSKKFGVLKNLPGQGKK